MNLTNDIFGMNTSFQSLFHSQISQNESRNLNLEEYTQGKRYQFKLSNQNEHQSVPRSDVIPSDDDNLSLYPTEYETNISKKRKLSSISPTKDETVEEEDLNSTLLSLYQNMPIEDENKSFLTLEQVC